MQRKAFTLIELLAVIAIMAAMVTVGVVSVASSRASTRVFAAGRDVMAAVRRARSLALVTQQPVVVVYSNATVEDEPCASVTIQAKKLFSGAARKEKVYNLAGDVVVEPDESEGESGGESLEDILSPESIPQDVVKGLKIKALDESDELQLPENETRRSKISIFSTADNVSRTLETPSGDGAASDASAAEEASDEPLKVAFAANGTVNPPHRIWIYRADSSPEKGICIHVDRFGEPKCDDFED